MTENQQFLLYTAPDGAVKVEVFFRGELVRKAAISKMEIARPVSDFDREIKRLEGKK